MNETKNVITTMGPRWLFLVVARVKSVCYIVRTVVESGERVPPLIFEASNSSPAGEVAGDFLVSDMESVSVKRCLGREFDFLFLKSHITFYCK